MTTSIADRFKARLAEETETGEFNGFPLRLRRMRAQALFGEGLMPMFFADVYRQARGAQPMDERNADQDRKLTTEEFDEMERFKNTIVADCCVEPKIKLKPDDEGDVDIRDVPDALREFIYLYSQRQLNFANFVTDDRSEKEEVTAATLTPFLYDREGTEESATADPRGPAIRSATEPDARAGDGGDVVDTAVSTGV